MNESQGTCKIPDSQDDTLDTRSLFLQMMANDEEGNGESTANVDHKYSQKHMSVFRTDRYVLQEKI